jgi:hypothetical protein
MPLFGHHTKSYLGMEIEVNGRTFPDGPFDHALFLGAVLLAAYGAFALIRDGLRWRRKRLARSAAR